MKLSIAEGLYLIALDDEEGRLLSAAEKRIDSGLFAAIILELYIQKRVGLEGGNVTILDSTGTGNGVMDKVLLKIKSGTSLTDQIENLKHAFKDIQAEMIELLLHRGILKRESTKLLWIPLSERMDNANYAFEQKIRDSLQVIVFKSAKPTPSYAIMMSLIYDCHILDEVFHDKDDLIDAVKVAKDIVDSPVLDENLSAALKSLKAYFGN